MIDLNRLGAPIDISIPLRFNGPQPNAFGVDRATAKPIGDTRHGSSVNFEQYTLTPHCNGTHTECVGHITDERLSIRECLKDIIMPAFVVSVEPEVVASGDSVISRRSLEQVLADVPANEAALIVRTLPNDESKLDRVYDDSDVPPYFSADAMRFIFECGVKHLLVDLPSVDRLFDDGRLENHRIFWNVDEGSCSINEKTRINSTITELIFVPETVSDGRYRLNLQIAPFDSDAAPSRPILLKIT